MSSQKSIKLNFFMNAILTISSFIFPLITFPYVSRILLPIGTGKVSFAISIITYFAMFAQLGIPTYGVRACAKVRDNRSELTKTAQEIFIINLIMMVISYFFFFVILFMVPRLQQDKTLYLIISVTILFNMIGMEWLYRALEQYVFITIRSAVCKLLALIAMFLFIHQQSDYVIYGGITVFAAVASSIFNFSNVHRYIGVFPVGNYNLKRHMKAILVFFAMSCATTIYTNLDTVMLGFMKTDTDVGYYSAAVKIKTILVSIVTSLGTVLLPRTSYYIEQGMHDEFRRITKKALNFVVLIATPMVFYFVLFAKEGIFFLSGKAYAGSILPMQIIMPTLLLIGLTNIMGIQILVPMGKEKIVLYSEIAGATMNVIVNIILIPKIASSGTAVGTLLAETVTWVVQYIALKDMASTLYREIRYLSILVAVILASVASAWVKFTNLTSFNILIVSAILFFGAFIGILTFTNEPLVLEIENQIAGKIRKMLRRT